MISRHSAITNISGKEFDYIRNLICESNDVEDYFINSIAAPIPLREITNENWISIAGSYRRAFFLESQFRSFYVDYLLKEIGDSKKFYVECRCWKNGVLSGYEDNCIKIGNKLCFVEVKLNCNMEKDLINQLEKYCFLEKCEIEKGRILPGKSFVNDMLLVIDVYNLYLYNSTKKQLEVIYNLDNLKCNEDLNLIRYIVIDKLNNSGHTT